MSGAIRFITLTACQCQRLVGSTWQGLHKVNSVLTVPGIVRYTKQQSDRSRKRFANLLTAVPDLHTYSCSGLSSNNGFLCKAPGLEVPTNCNEIYNTSIHQYRHYGTSNDSGNSPKDIKSHRLKIEKTKIKAKEVRETVEDTVREWKDDFVLTVPNALTSLRIVVTPLLGYLVLNESYSWACGLFVAAGITDLLDGYIARNFPGQASVFGSYLDPLADKILISVLFLSLTVVNLIPVPLTVLVVLRDLLLVAAAFYIRYITLPAPKTIKRYFDVNHATAQLHPTFISKLNTAVQLSLVTFTLGAPVLGYVDHLAMQALWYITAATTTASGITYMFAKDTVKILGQTKK